MPEEEQRVGACPHCGSRRIRIRQSVRPYYPWRCRNCKKAFRTPKTSTASTPSMVRRRRYVLAAHIPRLERPTRRLRRRILGYLALAVLVLGILAVVIIAAQQEVIRLPSTPVQVGDRSERVGVVSPDTTPPTTATRPPEAVAAQMTARTAVPTRTPSPTNVTAAKVITSREAGTQTPTFVPLATGTAALPPLASTSTTTPVSTAAVAVAPANTPTATPEPDKLLVLHTETAVEGYWSDGTANVGLELILWNEGSLALVGSQPIGVRCTIDDSGVQGCDANTEISLPDGFGPAAADLVLRVPMGLVKLDIDYGGEAPHFVSVNVPRRILGVDRDIWACYSDRSVANNSEGDHGCYGWYRPTVEKWRSGSTVRVWATGNDDYIRAFRETLDEQLAPVLNLTFEWVEDEAAADFVAVLGVSQSDALPGRWPSCTDAWGCGGVVDVRNGEVLKARLIMYHLESLDRFLDDYTNLRRVLDGVFIHEALHGLGPTGHAERSGVVLSIMRSAPLLTSIDKSILSLNSHPLVQPGMTMSQVRPLIMFEDELFDSPPQNELTSDDLLELALATLQRVDTVRMKIRGGSTGGGCDETFGRGNWAMLEIGGFDHPDDPELAYFQDGNDNFLLFYSNAAAVVDGDGWQHWQKARGGWHLISGDELWDGTAWRGAKSKLHYAITGLLRDYDADDIEVVSRSDGEITLSATYNPTETSGGELANDELTFTLVIDEDSYEIRRYEWSYHIGNWSYCQNYREEGRDIEYGVAIDIPAAVVERSEYALPRLWNR